MLEYLNWHWNNVKVVFEGMVSVGWIFRWDKKQKVRRQDTYEFFIAQKLNRPVRHRGRRKAWG